MTTLVAFGCSHTAGSALDVSKNIFQDYTYNKKHCFAGLIAKQYNLDYYNLAVPGGSNQYIFRSVSKFLLDYYDTSKDYIFLIGWTSPNRMELRYPEDSPYKHITNGDLIDLKYIPFTSSTAPHLLHSGEVRRMLGYSPLLFNEDLLNSNWASYAYGIQQMCKNKKIKYYMFNTCQELPINDTNKKIIQALDTDYYYNPNDEDSSMLIWGLNQGYEKTECWHLKQDGHQAWKQHIETKLQEIGYLKVS